MKKILRAAVTTVTGGGGGGNDDAEGAEEDIVENALSILHDHRELSNLPPPIPLPTQVVDPNNFPFYQPTSGWGITDGSDPPYVKELQNEAYKATLYIRDDWIRKQMKIKESSFTTKHEVKIWIGTFNANGKKPEFPVDVFVRAGEKKRGEKECADLVVVGLQEMVDLTVQNAVSDAATKERTNQWIELIQRSLNDLSRQNNEPEGYTLLSNKSLVGLMICCFVLKKHRNKVSGVQATSAATGVMGVVGNKGACSIRFDFFDTSFCFVCAHLAAHADAVDARNSDVSTINAKTSFKLDPPVRSFVPERHHSRIAATTPGALARGELIIKEHDYVIWLGDFNYRIDASKPAEEVFDHVNVKDFPWLLEHDQLINEMRSNRVFEGFQEVSEISFLPTYKFEPGTDWYDRRPDKKVRAPAWCDRIVWRTPQGFDARCLVYDRIDALRASDHKPVEASLIGIVRVINDDLRNEAYRDVLKKFEGTAPGLSSIESITVDKKSLDFGNVTYRQTTVTPLTLTLKNESQVPLCWRVMPRPGLNDLCAPWLTLEPSYGLLLGGDICQITVRCGVGLETARLAASGEVPSELRDVLDIRVHPVLDQGAKSHTKNFFLVKVQCNLLPTCFGAQIPSLLWALKPIRQFGSGEAQYTAFKTAGVHHPPLYIPKELWRLVNCLKNRLDSHRVFLLHADKAECAVVRNCLDDGTPFPKEVSTYAYASVLLEFLDALAEPVVPSDSFPDMESMVDLSWPYSFIAGLPSPNANVLAVIVSLLQRLMSFSHQNKLTLNAIAPLFAEVLFRPSLAAEANRETSAANATGLGEFANWLTTSASSSKTTDSRGTSDVATRAVILLVQGKLF